ncbi:MAG: LytTR family DNA-binding domain-containing protein [Pricia sp.]
MESIKCVVVDDEELARTLLCTYIEKLNFLELIDSVPSPVEAMQVMRQTAVDLLFLDIQMPEIKGTDFAKIAPANTQIIFTTAYSEYALEGFELNALDYLLKPITFERFLTAVNKFKSDTDEMKESMTIKSGYNFHKVQYADIRYIESDSEYVMYYTIHKKIMSNQSLSALEKLLPKSIFLRVHRSYIVNKNFVTELNRRDLLLSEEIIPVSDSYYDTVKLELFR